MTDACGDNLQGAILSCYDGDGTASSVHADGNDLMYKVGDNRIVYRDKKNGLRPLGKDEAGFPTRHCYCLLYGQPQFKPSCNTC